MIVVCRPNSPRDQVEAVIEEVRKLGYEPKPIYGEFQTVVAAIGDEQSHHTLETLIAWPQVEKVLRIQKTLQIGEPPGARG